MRLAVVAALLLLGLSAGAVLWAGHHLTKPAQVNTGIPDPALRAQSLTIESAAGLKLSAWYASGTSGAGAVLLLHPIRSNKRAMLSRARFLHASGFSVLLLDMQAHGESEGDRISFGYREAADVSSAAEALKALAPNERIGVLGVSLGGAAFLLSDAQPLVRAVVLESVYPKIEDAIANRLRIRFGEIGRWMAPLLLMQLGPRLGVSPGQLRPMDQTVRLKSPVLMIHGTEDKHTTLLEATRLFVAAPEPKELYLVANAGHVDLHRFAGTEYERRVGRFFARHLRTAHADTAVAAYNGPFAATNVIPKQANPRLIDSRRAQQAQRIAPSNPENRDYVSLWRQTEILYDPGHLLHLGMQISRKLLGLVADDDIAKIN